MLEKTKENRLSDILSNYEWNVDINLAMKSFVVLELESLLENNSTQAYWPAIIKERIKQLKGE